MRRLSASRLHIARHCTYWLRDEVPVDDKPSYASRGGTAFHSAAEETIHHGSPNLAGIADHNRLTARQVEVLGAQHRRWLAWYQGLAESIRSAMRPEIAMAWDPEAGEAKELPSKGHRDYSAAGPRAITGTADAVAVIDGVAHVWDWKSGGMYVEPPAKNPQILGLALMAAGIAGVRKVVGHIVRVSEDDCLPLSDSLDEMDLVAQEYELGQIAARMTPDAEPNPTPGGCRYCPAREHCGPGKELLVQLKASKAA